MRIGATISPVEEQVITRFAATWLARLTKGLRIMGDAITIPDKRGIIIPVALIGVVLRADGTPAFVYPSELLGEDW